MDPIIIHYDEAYNRQFMRFVTFNFCRIEDCFSFAHSAWWGEDGEEGEGEGVADPEGSWFRSELARLRFDLQG